jgi:hypothetical protein
MNEFDIEGDFGPQIKKVWHVPLVFIWKRAENLFPISWATVFAKPSSAFFQAAV